MLESFDFRNHFCLVFDLLGMSMYDFLRFVPPLPPTPPPLISLYFTYVCWWQDAHVAIAVSNSMHVACTAAAHDAIIAVCNGNLAHAHGVLHPHPHGVLHAHPVLRCEIGWR